MRSQNLGAGIPEEIISSVHAPSPGGPSEEGSTMEMVSIPLVLGDSLEKVSTMEMVDKLWKKLLRSSS